MGTIKGMNAVNAMKYTSDMGSMRKWRNLILDVQMLSLNAVDLARSLKSIFMESRIPGQRSCLDGNGYAKAFVLFGKIRKSTFQEER